MPETTEFCDFQLEKCIPIISLQALRRQFSKMEDAGNIEVPNVLPPLFQQIGPNSAHCLKQKKEYLEGFLRYLEFFKSFWKDI